MNKIHEILYISDNKIYLNDIRKNKIYEGKFKSLKADEIINSKLFINEFYDFLNKNHLKQTLFGRNIKVIINTYNKLNIEKIIEVLNECYNHIEIISLEKLLKIDINTAYIYLNKSYIDFYYQKKNEIKSIRIYLYLFHESIEKTIKHILVNIYKPKKVVVFGNIDYISKIAEIINKKFNIETNFPENFYNYIIEECKK